LPKASSLEVELKNNFPQADISLISSGGGVFEISLNGDLIFSKKALNRFTDGGEIKKLIMDRLE
jgi:selenoprotein W-related protein